MIRFFFKSANILIFWEKRKNIINVFTLIQYFDGCCKVEIVKPAYKEKLEVICTLDQRIIPGLFSHNSVIYFTGVFPRDINKTMGDSWVWIVTGEVFKHYPKNIDFICVSRYLGGYCNVSWEGWSYGFQVVLQIGRASCRERVFRAV